MLFRAALLASTALAFASAAHADCPPATVADMRGLSPEHPQQFELAEFQQKAECEVSFAENPQIAALNGEILGNGELPRVAERLPVEPLVVASYESIGEYGGTLNGLSKATEAGTSDILSVRHVNLVRYADDLQTIVPNIAKSWEWNDDHTELTFSLREGHRWSDGEPFTADDVAFWYNDLILNPDAYEKTPERWLYGGEPYTIDFAPTFGENVFYSFNRTTEDPVLREIFNDVRFNCAMSLAMNREEINEIVYLGQGTPMQGVPAERKTVDFVAEEQLTASIEHDPEAANALLDEMGLMDTDGDGVRERPDGRPLVLRVVYANQGAPVKLHELVRDYWSNVGLRVDLREVTSDEYRAAGNNNDLDVTVWKYDNIAGPTISQDIRSFAPPFGDYFNPGTGFEWAAYRASDGEEGEEPPAYIKKLYELSDEFIQTEIGTPESSEIGAEIVDIHVDDLLKIGTVGDIVGPFMHSNALKNVKPITAKTYDFYWVYPYRPQQWWLDE